jgi:2-amino-4-hydroxy-6-hydroxymethyldihydropteridine diphosphokinase
VATRAYIALGSNLGDRLAHLHAALDALAALPGTVITERSDIIETEPVGSAAQGRYLNAVAALDTALAARALLDALLAIESSAGRVRSASSRWGPRTLDLDLLLFGDGIIAERGLIVPHPRLHERRFVLEPLAQIAPDAVHPVIRRTIRDLLHEMKRAP